MDTNVHQVLPRVSVKKQKKNSPIHFALNQKTLQKQLTENIDINILLQLDKSVRAHTHKKILLPILKQFIRNTDNLSSIMKNSFAATDNLFTIVKSVIELIECAIDQKEASFFIYCHKYYISSLDEYLSHHINYTNYREKYENTRNAVADLNFFVGKMRGWGQFYLDDTIFESNMFSYIARDIMLLTSDNVVEKTNSLLKMIFTSNSSTKIHLHCGLIFYKLQQLNVDAATINQLNVDGIFSVCDPVRFSDEHGHTLWETFDSPDIFFDCYVESGFDITLDKLLAMMNANDDTAKMLCICYAHSLDITLDQLRDRINDNNHPSILANNDNSSYDIKMDVTAGVTNHPHGESSVHSSQNSTPILSPHSHNNNNI